MASSSPRTAPRAGVAPLSLLRLGVVVVVAVVIVVVVVMDVMVNRRGCETVATAAGSSSGFRMGVG
jgi:hypothetical protein